MKPQSLITVIHWSCIELIITDASIHVFMYEDIRLVQTGHRKTTRESRAFRGHSICLITPSVINDT